MRFSGATSVAAAALILLSLAGKLLVDRPDFLPDLAMSGEAARAFLTANGFSVRVRPHKLGPTLYGRKGSCYVMLAEEEVTGVNAALLASRAREVGREQFVYRGRFFDQPPLVRPMLDLLVARQLHRMGFNPVRRPLWAAASNGRCRLEQMNWSALRTLRR
jgi:hypothetical protein